MYVGVNRVRVVCYYHIHEFTERQLQLASTRMTAFAGKISTCLTDFLHLFSFVNASGIIQWMDVAYSAKWKCQNIYFYNFL